MKKRTAAALLAAGMLTSSCAVLAGCTEAERASYNISKQAGRQF